MRVFVAGATGAIGRPLVPKLIEAGHEVTGMTRSEQGAERLRAADARAVVADVFDEQRVRDAVADAGPEVVIHELTALPDVINPRRAATYAQTNRLRSEGTRILIEAAEAAGARRMVAQSIAFAYAAAGEPVKSEDAALALDGAGSFTDSVRAIAELERRVTEAEQIEGLVLRYGFFYGPGTHYAPDGSQARMVRRRMIPIVGEGGGTFSFIHIDDAADATVAAVERGTPGVYNVVDDEPAPMREWLPVYAEALGAKRPRRMPVWLTRLVGGKEGVTSATQLRGASNEKVKRELGWEPRHRSWRQGFAESLR
jgi:nucleoside-diphosphate-sugar epimerase